VERAGHSARYGVRPLYNYGPRAPDGRTLATVATARRVLWIRLALDPCGRWLDRLEGVPTLSRMPPPLDPTRDVHDPNRAEDEPYPSSSGAESLARELAERSPSRLAAALRITEAVIAEPTLATAMEALVDGVHRALEPDIVALLLLEDGNPATVLVTRATRGSTSDEATAIRIPLGRGLIGKIAQRHEAVIVPDVREMDDVPSVLTLERVASVLGVPVSDQGRPVGVLYVGARTRRRYSDDDRFFLELVAAGAGPAVARARMADALQLYRRQLEEQTGELEATASELELTVQALRRANAELAATAESARAAQVSAESANRAKSAFLATMSHELRTPLNAILGYASLLLDGLAGPLEPAQRDFVERTRSSGRHLLGLIEEVLDIAKVEAGQMRVEVGPVASSRVVNAAVTLVRPLAANGGVDIDASRCTDMLGELAGDERRVRQILLNLLANAVKFTRPGGRIALRCDRVEGKSPFQPARLGSWLRIAVTDTGIGIEPEHLETIFEPFVQLDASHTRSRGGSGLGLAISRRFARLMGGEISVTSRVGQGTTFTLWLPAWERDRPATALLEPTPHPDQRTPRAQLATARIAGTRAGRVALGELLVATAPDIVAAVVDNLRGDPQMTRAREVTRAELEDHIATYLSDIGQLFAILDERAATRLPLLVDGTAIQHLIAERHGAQRRRLGWTEEELRREHETLVAEVERVATDASMLTGSPPSDTIALLRVILHEAFEISLHGYRGLHGRRERRFPWTIMENRKPGRPPG